MNLPDETLSDYDQGVFDQINADLAHLRHLDQLLHFERRDKRLLGQLAVAGWLSAAVLVFAKIFGW